MKFFRRFRVRVLPRAYLVSVFTALSLFTAMATGFDLFYRLSYVLALIAVLAFIWTWRAVKPLTVQVERRTRQANVGDIVEEDVTVRNRSILPKFALEVGNGTNLPGYTGGQVINLWGHGSGSWTLQTQAKKRGVYTLGPISMGNSDPFGLFQQTEEYGDVDSVTIFPRAYDLSRFKVPAADLSGDSSTRRRTHTVTPHASTVRDYSSGDSLSRVHWNSTARLGKLMSKEFDLGKSGEVWVLVDLYKDAHAGELEESTDEYAVSIGASLARRYLESNQPVGLIAYGDRRYFLPADTGEGQMDRIMQFLAMSKAEGSTPLEVLLPTEEALWSHHSSVVVITAAPEGSWIMALRELAKRGIRVAVVLVDALSFGGYANTETALEHLYLAGVPAYFVRRGDDIPASLSRQYDGGATAVTERLDEVGISV